MDRVVLYDEPTPLRVIASLRPDVLVKGADWAADEIVGRAEVEEAGGRVVRVALVPGRSTSAVLTAVGGRRPTRTWAISGTRSMPRRTSGC